MNINADVNLLHKSLFSSSLYMQSYWFEVDISGHGCINNCWMLSYIEVNSWPGHYSVFATSIE